MTSRFDDEETLRSEPMRKSTRRTGDQIVHELLGDGKAKSAFVFYLRPEKALDVRAKFSVPNKALSSKPPYFSPSTIESSGKVRYQEYPVEAAMEVRMLNQKQLTEVLLGHGGADSPVSPSGSEEGVDVNSKELYYRAKIKLLNENVEGAAVGLKLASPVSAALNVPTVFAFFGIAKFNENKFKFAIDPKHNVALLSTDLAYKSLRLTSTLSATTEGVHLKKCAIGYVGEANPNNMPTRFELLAQSNGKVVEFSYGHQMLWYGRHVSLGGKFVQAIDPNAATAKGKETASAVIGGKWQIARHTFLKAKCDTQGTLNASVWTTSSRISPAVSLRVMAETKLYSPAESLRLGAIFTMEYL